MGSGSGSESSGPSEADGGVAEGRERAQAGSAPGGGEEEAGPPWKCRVCASVRPSLVLLNEESRRAHEASKGHLRRLKAQGPGELGSDVIIPATMISGKRGADGGGEDAEEEMETHAERLARLKELAAAPAPEPKGKGGKGGRRKAQNRRKKSKQRGKNAD